MTEITCKKLILVEGKDEELFFEEFIKYLQITDCQILTVKGKNNFKNILETIVNLRGFSMVKYLVIIADADNSALNSFIAIRNLFKGLNLPAPLQEGNFVQENGMHCGIFIMPEYPNNGMLENLCLETIDNPLVINCIDKFVECIENKPNNLAKMKMQIYLSTLDPIVNSIGIAARKGYWNFNSTGFEKLKLFMSYLKEV